MGLKCRFGAGSHSKLGIALSLLLGPDPSNLSLLTQTYLSQSGQVYAEGKDAVMVERESSGTQPTGYATVHWLLPWDQLFLSAVLKHTWAKC